MCSHTTAPTVVTRRDSCYVGHAREVEREVLHKHLAGSIAWFLVRTAVVTAVAVTNAGSGTTAMAVINTAACVSTWWVSYGSNSGYMRFNTDLEGLPLDALYFSRSYNAPHDPSKGYLDFDGDGRSDVFSALPIGGGNYRWQ